jgi:hypothetical protein
LGRGLRKCGGNVRDWLQSDLGGFGACTIYSMLRALHVSLGSAWACIWVLGYELLSHIGAPFEETFPRCFQQCGCLGITQRLMFKFDGIGLRLHKVGEVHEVDFRLVVGSHCGMVGGSSQGPGRGRRYSPGVVPTIPCLMGSIHKSVDGSLNPVKITFPLNITLHLLLSNTTLYPALQRGQMPMTDAINNDGTMCPVNILCRPVILLSHTCVDWIFFAVGQIDCEGGYHDTFIVHGDTVHYEDGSCARVRNCLVGGNS